MYRGIISIVRSDTHYEGTLKALELIDSEIRGVVCGRWKFLIKPNFVSTSVYLSATPKETVDAILNYLYENYDASEVLIAESPASARAEEGYRNYSYYELRKKHPGLEFGVYVLRLLLDKSFVKISPCRAKTHNTVVVTLSIKNMVMGGIRRGYQLSSKNKTILPKPDQKENTLTNHSLRHLLEKQQYCQSRTKQLKTHNTCPEKQRNMTNR